jgi:hypothetical protein
MFNKKDMMISVAVAEKMIKDTEERFEKTVESITDEVAEIINEMKQNSLHRGKVKIRNLEWDLGEESPFHVDGIKLFTGDEVIIQRNDVVGVKGVVTKDYKGLHHIYTNREVLMLTHSLTEHLVINKHFNTYIDGQEIAKGRRGGEGFIVELS